MKIDLTQMATFGVAGNFTGHLEQAGEDKDFLNIKTAEAIAPKALFPTYIPGAENSSAVPEFLGVFPFDSNKIVFPAGEEKLQIEPECAVVFNVVWKNNLVTALSPVCFGASNDCSIRKEGAKKISLKKNWGKFSKGFAENLISLDSFNSESVIDKYRIASFLVRNGTAFEYGEDSRVGDYSYIYEKLINWIIDKLNNQEDFGPAEKIHDYLVAANYPEQIMISIGATRYTDYGEHNYLNLGDEAVVILYPGEKYTKEQIKQIAEGSLNPTSDVSVLREKIC